MFDIFGENCLTHINTTANADAIKAFKRSHKTKEAFDCLFEPDDNNTLSYIEAIKKKTWEKKNTTGMDTAFTLAVCEIVLNPKHPKISVDDNALCNQFDVYWIRDMITNTCF